MFELPQIWAGTDESFAFTLSAMARAEQELQARGGRGSDPFEMPPLAQLQDGVGIVNVHGPLISGSAGYMRLFGLTGYEDIQAGVMEMAKSKDAKAIILDVATSGGAVEGADETSEFIASVAKLKPVITYSSGNMLSAGTWVGSAGVRRLASRTSLQGSIGVIMTHTDRTKMLEKEGITKTIVRSGRWKGLGGPDEPLSKDALAWLEGLVQSLNSIFEARVAENLGVSKDRVHDKMGQGRVFLAADALEVGLIDGIASFQEAFLTAKILGKS